MKNITIHDGEHYSAVVCGGGQAGLAVSHELLGAGIDHVVIEKKTVVHQWKEGRWDNFTLVTPNWHCSLPGYSYDGDAPDGFMTRDEVYEWVRAYPDTFDAPVAEHTSVLKVEQVASVAEGAEENVFEVITDRGVITANAVVSATGGYQIPMIPEWASKLPERIQQIHSHEYKNASQLAEGAVLVVGTGQSGTQIAEDLMLEGRQVHLACGHAPRVARFYRGKDCMTWLAEMGVYDVPIDKHGEAKAESTNHYVTGRDGGRDIDLRVFAKNGMKLYGLALDVEDGAVTFDDTVAEKLDYADSVMESIKNDIDKWIEEQGIDAPVEERYMPVWEPEPGQTSLNVDEISSIVWSIGFRPDWSFIESLGVLSESARPVHKRGETAVEGFYFIGLPWMHTWGSGRFLSVGADATYVAGLAAKSITSHRYLVSH